MFSLQLQQQQLLPYCLYIMTAYISVTNNNLQYARQIEFDQLINDMLIEGMSLEDAVIETKETFIQSNYDLSLLFIYQNKSEYDVNAYINIILFIIV